MNRSSATPSQPSIDGRTGAGRRILVVAPRPPGESERWMARSIDGLRPNIAGFASIERPTIWSNDAPPLYRIGTGRFASRYGLYRLTRSSDLDTLENAVAESGANAILVHYAHLADLLLSSTSDALGTLPILVRVHGLDVTWSPFRRFPINYKNLGNDHRYLSRLLNVQDRALFVANSEFTKQRLLIAGFNKRRTTRIYLGVPQCTKPRRLRAQRPQILFLGRLVGVKGPLETIQAFNLLRSQGTDAKLVLAGDGPLRRAVSASAQESPYRTDIDLLGAVSWSMANRLISESDLLTMHNQRGRTGQVEALGVAFLEAMSCGLPVVTGRSGSTPEVIRQGVSGFTFKPGSIAAHAEALRASLSDEWWSVLSTGARSRADQVFSLRAERSETLRSFDLEARWQAGN